MVPKFQVAQNKPVGLEIHGCAKDISSESQTSSSDQVSGLPEPKDRNSKAQSWLILVGRLAANARDRP